MLMAEYDYEMDIKIQREEAEHNEKIETAKRMMKMGQFTPEIIAQVSGLSADEVNELTEKK